LEAKILPFCHSFLSFLKLFFSPLSLIKKEKKVKKSVYSSLILFISFFITLVLSGKQEAKFNSKIEEKNRVKIVKNPEESRYGEIEFDLERDLVIGSDDDERYTLLRVWDIKADDRGNIYVLDSGAYRIQKYDREGKYVQTIGRQGQGPGEFERPINLHFDKNRNLYVAEMRKIHMFDPEGEFLKTITIPFFYMDFAADGTGNFFVTGHVRADSAQNLGVLLINSQGEIVKKIAEFPGVPRHRTGVTLSHEYSPSLRFSALGDVGIIYGYNPEYKLYCTNWSGKNVLIIEKDEPYRSISRGEKNKIIDDAFRNAASAESEWPRNVVEKMANLPKHRPFFDRILVDEKGRLYVRKLKSVLDESRDEDFDIFGSNGNFLYSTKLPFTPLDIKYGCLYQTNYSEKTGEVQVVRWKIRNWKHIKEGIQK